MKHSKSGGNMWYVVSYDIRSPRRLPKLLKLCRRYLHHVQYSVFEGELSEAQMAELQKSARRQMDLKEDSMIVYSFGDRRWESRTVIGVDVLDEPTFI